MPYNFYSGLLTYKEMHFASNPGLASEILGETNTNAPLIVIGHGAMGSRESDDALGIPDWRLCAEWARVFRYDAIGHGQSPVSERTEEYTWAHQGTLLLSELLLLPSSLTDNGIVMVGSSMSVGSALHALVNAPEFVTQNLLLKIRLLVLTIPPTSWELRNATRAAMNIWANKVESEGVDAFWEYLCSFPPMPFMANARPDYRDIVGPFIKNMSPKALSGLFRASALSDFPDRSGISGITTPTLILCRTGDPLHPTSIGEELNALLPNSTLVISESGTDVKGWPELVRQFVANTGRLAKT